MSDGGSPAATDGAVEGARPGVRRFGVQWPAWLPKTVLLTAALTLLTAWFFPALSRQWQDRQKARELKASLVSQIGKETSEALITSSFLTWDRFPSSRDPSERGWNQEVFNRLDLQWRRSSAEVEAQLRAYFPDRVAARWRAYSDLVWGTYRLITDNESARPSTVLRLREEVGVKQADLNVLSAPWVDKYGNTVDRRREGRARIAYFRAYSALLSRRSAVIDEILRSHPAGYSTRLTDLAHDLLAI
jgi:hypothetical protein